MFYQFTVARVFRYNSVVMPTGDRQNIRPVPRALSQAEPTKLSFRSGQSRRLATAAVFSLTALRAVLAPLLIFIAWRHAPGWMFAGALTAAFLSDIYDGVIARRFGVATAALRRFDSVTDTFFYFAAVYAVWLLYPEVLRSNLPGILVLGGLEITRYAYDFLKFGREASYHMWSAKLWGIGLFAAFLALLGFGSASLIPCAIALGVLADLEGLAASVILKSWQHDIPSIRHAWHRRLI
jgi:phosphatidylglycerophosphate synthase